MIKVNNKQSQLENSSTMLSKSGDDISGKISSAQYGAVIISIKWL